MPITKLLTFKEAIEKAIGNGGKMHLLMGNGFSRACFDDKFSYTALFDSADFSKLSVDAKTLFSTLETTDFEAVIEALNKASMLVKIYESSNKKLAENFKKDAEILCNVLVKTIANSHPDKISDVARSAYLSCRKFLSHFDTHYTLNYDLLLYWALMQDDLGGDPVKKDDGFRTPSDEEELEYVTWEVENTDQQNIHYLHGALHIFDSGIEIQKYTWKNTGIRLIDQIRDALKKGFYPLFVSEGNSDSKLRKINHSNYLSRNYRSFAHITGNLFIYGHSLNESDEHIIKLIKKGKIKHLFVSLYGSPDKEGNKLIVKKIKGIQLARPQKKPLHIDFYDAESAKIWEKKV